MPLTSPGFHLDALSFWMGIITATLFWWFLRGLLQLWPSIKASFLSSARDLHKNQSNSLEERLRREVVRQTQGLHIAFPLFSLDEIAITPHLLAPPPQASPETASIFEDVISQSVVYTPDWPELSAVFGGSTLEIYDPLTTGNLLAIVGQPGSGKTTALAYLAGQVGRRECPLADLNECIPLYLHVLDLPASPTQNGDPLKPILDLYAQKGAAFGGQQAATLLRASFTSGKLLLLLDGVDELPAINIREFAKYLESLVKAFPQARMVITVSPEYWDGLTQIGFRPYSIASWSHEDINRFLDGWSIHWANLIEPLNPDKKKKVDPAILKNWLFDMADGTSPFDRTLITWAAFSGDVRGPNPIDALEAFIRRIIDPGIRGAIEQIALQFVLFAQPGMAKNELESALSRLSPTAAPIPPAPVAGALIEGPKNATPSSVTAEPPRREISSLPVRFLVENGVLNLHGSERYSFFHPILAGYLAACALQKKPDQASRLVSQQGWIGKNLALCYLGAFCDMSAIIEPSLADAEEPLYRSIFLAARWLREAKGSPGWKIRVMRSLVEIVQADPLPYGIRQRALTALVCSHDPGLAALFKQFVDAKSSVTAQLAALGCGAIREKKLVPDLIELLNSMNSPVVHCAVLALVSMGGQAAIEAVARTLLTGDESSRRAAAEALANHPSEGYAILKDGSVLSDILVRRAVVFGLARVKEKWARETLEKMRIEDGQWVVRNAAAQTVEALELANPRVYKQLPPPAQAPWVIAFAARQGIGIAGDSPAIDMLLMAVKVGDEDERLAALEYLARLPQPDVISALFETVYKAPSAMRETAVNILSEFSAAGVTLPAPSAYGLGRASLR
jgi:HEAT repeat protein